MIYIQKELEIKDTTDAHNRASYLDLLLSADSDLRLKVKLYDKRDEFSFPIVNFPFMSSNIPESPAFLPCTPLYIPHS